MVSSSELEVRPFSALRSARYRALVRVALQSGRRFGLVGPCRVPECVRSWKLEACYLAGSSSGFLPSGSGLMLQPPRSSLCCQGFHKPYSYSCCSSSLADTAVLSMLTISFDARELRDS